MRALADARPDVLVLDDLSSCEGDVSLLADAVASGVAVLTSSGSTAAIRTVASRLGTAAAPPPFPEARAQGRPPVAWAHLMTPTRVYVVKDLVQGPGGACEKRWHYEGCVFASGG
jgi:hypothetical protein